MARPDPLAPTPEFQARILQGRELAERGDFAAAEAIFLSLLSETRGGHPGDHARALATLSTLYGRAGRYVQAHALASRLAAVARAAGPEADATLAFALAKACGALSQLGVLAPLDDALEELRRVLDRHPISLPNLELEYHVAAATGAYLRGQAARARAHVEDYRRTLDAHRVPDGVYRWALTMVDARVLLLEGRAEEAHALLGRPAGEAPTPAFAPLHQLVLAVEVHARLGQREAAVEQARRALDLLATVERDPFLAADYVHQGDLLARALERLGEGEPARRAYDLMAVAVLLNLRQVDDCIRALPELGMADAASHAALALFRKQFLKDQRRLLGRVAALLARRPDYPVNDLLSLPNRTGFVPVCAWCESVRTSEGVWLPIGHYVPREGSFRLTHGICPPCVEQLQGEVP